MKISPVRVFIFAVVILLVGAGVVYAINQAVNFLKPPADPTAIVQNLDQQVPPTDIPTKQPTKVPEQAAVKPKPTSEKPKPTAVPQDIASPTALVEQSVPLNGTNPVLVCDGRKTQLDVALDSYAGFFPLIYRIAAMPESDHYCIKFIPKWYGAKNNLEENQIEEMVREGSLDVYFASNGALSLYDSNSGKAIWTTDQSRGADQINAWTDISTTGNLSFNDVRGQTILVSKGSAGHYFILKILQTTNTSPDEVNIVFSGSPTDDFANKKGKVVSYWDPAIRSTYLPGTKILVTTGFWPVINDYIFVSPKAYEEKEEALKYFLADYIAATDAFTKENLPNTANVLANFTFEGQNMSGWLAIDKDNPFDSLNKLVDGVGFATLNTNVAMFETDPTGSNLVVDQLIRTRKTWQFGKVSDNGNTGSIFDPNNIVSNKFVSMMLEGDVKQIRGEFNKPYDTDVSRTPPKVDIDTLIKLPEILSLPLKDIKFEKGYSNLLAKGEEESIIQLVQPISYMMNESDDSTILIKGGSGNYTTNPLQKIEDIKFAFRRAQFIRDLLSQKLGIPLQRIIIDPNVILPDHDVSNNPEELSKYMVVVIKVLNTGNFK